MDSAGETWLSGQDPVAAAVSEFGHTVARKLQRPGQKEDQLRGPIEVLLTRLGGHFGLDVQPYGEVALRTLRARPDYAVDIGETRIGYIEIKAPGKGVPPDWRPSARDQKQWEKLKSLPNLVYTDGSSWAHYCYGVRTGPAALLDGDITWAGSSLRPIDREFKAVLRRFLRWSPEAPPSLQALIKVVSGLCRLLRAEVTTILEQESSLRRRPFTRLAEDWRNLLFPKLSESAFADAYAQTVTFSLLLARASGVSLGQQSLRLVADQLGKHHPLMGRALDVLTNPPEARQLSVIETLRQIIGAVDWDRLEGATSEYWVIYEDFLDKYDPHLRRKSGSYYTPDAVARFIVEFVDEIIKTRLDRPRGFAADDVVVLDPGMGTGTFLVEVVRSAAETIAHEQGEHARPGHLRDLYRRRLVGFERQAAPFVVAELRLRQVLKEVYSTEVPDDGVRFLTNTFDDPGVQTLPYGQMYEELEEARESANRIKRDTPVLVVLGNPTYLEHARQRDPAPWIETPRPLGRPPDLSRPALDDFKLRVVGRKGFKLSSLYVYFWRWATWKVFDAHPDQPMGIVAFITPSSYLTGAAFAGMRSYLRRTADEGWIIDLSPEGHRSNANTRIFTGVQQRISIGIFARYGNPDPTTPAHVHHLKLAGDRSDKIGMLTIKKIGPSGAAWEACPSGWIDEFAPVTESWASYPRLSDLMPWQRPGVSPYRTWVYAPDEQTLQRRWAKLIMAPIEDKNQMLGVTDARTVESLPRADPRIPAVHVRLREESSIDIHIEPVAFRSFDRQFLILDPRVIDRIRPELWGLAGPHQVFVTEQHTNEVTAGPGITFSALVPDKHHFEGHHGGRVLPLYRDTTGDSPNLAPGLVRYLSMLLGIKVTATDVLAYIAGVVAHGGYTRRFKRDLAVPGIHVPLTAHPDLWSQAVEIGREVIWLHTYGSRYVDSSADRPPGPPRLPAPMQPRPSPAIPSTPDRIPNRIDYDPASQTLIIGDGAVAPVPRPVWEYKVGSMQVITEWFESRRAKPRHKRRTSELDDIRAPEWTYRFTDDLLNLLHVLGRSVLLEPMQAQLLKRICEGPLITVTDLEADGVFPVPATARRLPGPQQEGTLPI